MAQIDLGSIKFNWKGSYSGATAYVVDDVVESSGSSYICIAATTGNAPPNASYWEQMSSAGTNGTDGTDLTSTLTTQGDILYRDGSGLQRLAKGTAGQELRINSGATAPEWYTPTTASSDYVKISSGSFSSVSALDLDGTSAWGASNTYSHHKLILRLKVTSFGAQLHGRLLASGSTITSAIYSYAVDYIGSHNNAGGGSNVSAGESATTFQFSRDGVNDGGKQVWDFDIYNMNYGSSIDGNDDCFKYVAHSANINHDATDRMHGTQSFGSIVRGNAPSNQTGLRFYANAGNITGEYHIYGIKK